MLSRANKSLRLFEHVAGALRDGTEIGEEMEARIGYPMRTTAVYGNGKFGIADRDVIAERPGLEGPFMAEMLTVWLIRGFTHVLVDRHFGWVLPLDFTCRQATAQFWYVSEEKLEPWLGLQYEEDGGNLESPLDMARCKLSFFETSKFDPKSDRWTQITLAQGAPLRDELGDADDWWLPVFAA